MKHESRQDERARREASEYGTSRDVPRDYDRDRYGYDHAPSAARRHGHHRYADQARDAWQGRGAGDEPREGDGRGMSTRDYGYGYDPQHEGDEERAARQRIDDRVDWEPRTHGRTFGEQGYGAQYRGREGWGPHGTRKPLGRGPKGYVRSDERLKEEISERLASQDYDWSQIEVQVTAGVATLTGTVPTREMKYEAERVADSVRGVEDVMNQIRVKYEHS